MNKQNQELQNILDQIANAARGNDRRLGMYKLDVATMQLIEYKTSHPDVELDAKTTKHIVTYLEKFKKRSNFISRLQNDLDKEDTRTLLKQYNIESAVNILVYDNDLSILLEKTKQSLQEIQQQKRDSAIVDRASGTEKTKEADKDSF